MITLVTGGSGSGKSEYAEGLILDSPCSRRFYVATMIAYGKEGRDKVMRHRMLRSGKKFITIEKPWDVGNVVLEKYEAGPSASSRADRVLLLECVSNLAANEMFREDGTAEAAAGAERQPANRPENQDKGQDENQNGNQDKNQVPYLADKLAADIISLAGQVEDMVIVTNEVDRDGICYGQETMEYIRLMGRLNQKLAAASDRVAEVVYGIPVLRKPLVSQAAAEGIILPEGSDLRGRECQGK